MASRRDSPVAETCPPDQPSRHTSPIAIAAAGDDVHVHLALSPVGKAPGSRVCSSRYCYSSRAARICCYCAVAHISRYKFSFWRFPFAIPVLRGRGPGRPVGGRPSSSVLSRVSGRGTLYARQVRPSARPRFAAAHPSRHTPRLPAHCRARCANCRLRWHCVLTYPVPPHGPWRVHHLSLRRSVRCS